MYTMLYIWQLKFELFCNYHLGFRALAVDDGTDEGAHFAFRLVAQSSSWCSGGWLWQVWNIYCTSTWAHQSMGISVHGCISTYLLRKLDCFSLNGSPALWLGFCPLVFLPGMQSVTHLHDIGFSATACMEACTPIEFEGQFLPLPPSPHPLLLF